jgi:hypothetical protein
MSEAETLVNTVKALCPAQAMDDLAAAAWQLVLDDVQLSDAMAAVRQIARRPTDKALFIDPRQVLTEVRRIRGKRIEDTESQLTGAPRDPAAYLEWLKTARRQLGDGEYEPLPEISTGHTIKELGII